MRACAARTLAAAHEAVEMSVIVNGAAAGASVPSAGTVEGMSMSSKMIVARAGAEPLRRERGLRDGVEAVRG